MKLQIPLHLKSLDRLQPRTGQKTKELLTSALTPLFLDSNESPFGPSALAVQAIQAAHSEINRYPDPSGFSLRHALAQRWCASLEEIALGNGSNELIDLLIRAYCERGDAIAISKTAFIAYRNCALQQNIRVLEVETQTDLKADLGAILTSVQDDPHCKIVFLANPNNPTGTYCTDTEVKWFLTELAKIRQGSVLIVLDSAYAEYVSVRDLTDPGHFRAEFPNLVVLHTFSKAYGLAALRVGYALADKTVIELIEKVRQPYHVNSLALAAAGAALQDDGFLKRVKTINERERKKWELELSALGVPFWPSQGNFILIDTRSGFGTSGTQFADACAKEGVILRPVSNYGLPQAVRLTLGSEEQNAHVLLVFKQIKFQNGNE